MPSVFITGASRGIGFEFARQYSAAGWTVHAGARCPDNADALKSLNNTNLTIHQLDVTRHDEIAAVAETLAGTPIDLLINNAGVIGGDRQTFGDINYDAWAETLRTNTIGPYRVFEALQENLLLGTDKKAIFISSRMGSIEQYDDSDHFIYRSSKTALNMVVVNLDYEFKSFGICFVAFHPGWVQTDMGGSSATLKPSESASSLRESIAKATQAQSGQFLNFDGTVLPW